MGGVGGRMNGELSRRLEISLYNHVSEHFMFFYSLGLGTPEAGEFCNFS